MNNSSAFRSSLVLVLLLIVMYLLNGCSADFQNLPEVNTATTKQVPIGDLHGSTYGGQQPIYQSRVYLMAASTTGYGTTSTSLLRAAANTVKDAAGNYYVPTDGGGNFNITGDYFCTNSAIPSQSQQLYILSLSGNATYIPGTTPTGGTTNPYIGLMAALGACPSDNTFAGHISFIFVNEVSTVAAGYALAAFATTNGALTTPSNGGAIGSPNNALAMTGLYNAFNNANQLYDILGTSASHEARLVTPGGNGTVPFKLVNTMANILAACINSNNVAAVPPTSALACNTLYADSANSPDTASAMLYIAQHPAANVAGIYGLAGSSVQFIDNLSAAPKDFTAGIIYTGTGLSTPVDVAIDANGDAWVTSSAGTVSNLTPLGTQTPGAAAVVGPPAVAAIPASPYTVPTANYVAIDQLGNAWITSKGGNKVYELSNIGNTVTGSPYTNSDYNAPAAIALDGSTSGKAFIANSAGANSGAANSGGDIVKITGTGSTATSAIYTNTATSAFVAANQLPGVNQIAVDSAGFVWASSGAQACFILSCGGPNLVRVSGTSFLNTTAGYFIDSGSSTGTPKGIAIDATGNAWVAVNGTSDSLARVTAANAVTQYTGGGINNPLGVAVDGASNIWVANTGNSTLSEFSYTGGTTGTATALTTTAGDAVATLTAPTKLDIDGSGNIWVVNSTGVTEIIGSAAPTIRPLAAAVVAGKLGSRP
jgi:hypothetical protein